MYFGRHFARRTGRCRSCSARRCSTCGTISIAHASGRQRHVGRRAGRELEGQGAARAARPRPLGGDVRSLPLIAHWLDGEPLEDAHRHDVQDRGPDPHLRRRRRAPSRPGVVSVGDAWACSNPIARPRRSIGILHGAALRDLLRDVGLDDPLGFATRLPAATESEVAPWFLRTRARTATASARWTPGSTGSAYRPGDEATSSSRRSPPPAGATPTCSALFVRAAMVLERLDDVRWPTAAVAAGSSSSAPGGATRRLPVRTATSSSRSATE